MNPHAITLIAKAVVAVLIALLVSHWLIGGQQAIIEGPLDQYDAPSIVMKSEVQQ